MIQPDVIVFDFDLTLADSTRAFVACHEHAAAAMGLALPPAAAVWRTIGTPLGLAFVELYGDQQPALADAYNRHYQSHADAVMTGLTVMLPGAAETVRALATAGLRLAIVSQKRTYRVEEVLRREGLRDLFEAVIGDPELPAFKPDPAGILLAIERLGGTVATSWYVGDTVIDAEAARRAGVGFVAVLTGDTDAAEFAPYAPLAVVEDVTALPALLSLDAARSRTGA